LGPARGTDVFSCVGRALAMGWSPVKGILQNI
jgi:hypothetical protein